MPVTVDLGVLPDDELKPQGRIFFGGIWWNSSWAEDMDLYDDHEYWRCEDDATMEGEAPEEEDDEEFSLLVKNVRRMYNKAKFNNRRRWQGKEIRRSL